MTSNPSIKQFVVKQRELLDLELQAEKEEGATTDSSGSKGINTNDKTEGRRSHVLGRLEASDVSVGLYGRTVVQLTPWSSPISSSCDEKTNDASGGANTNTNSIKQINNLSPLLPAHRFTVGNEVEIRAKGGGNNNQKSSISGVICAVSEESISVAIFENKQSSSKPSTKAKGNSNRGGKSSRKKDTDNDEDDETSILDLAPLSLVPRSSIEVHKRLVAALDRLEKHGDDHVIAGSIIRSVFSPSGFSCREENVPKQQQQQHPCFNPGLDVSQREAIDFVLQGERPISLIHGPPGTGKTTTVAELIRQAVHYHGMRVLVAAPSNVAVDNILEKLTEPTTKHPTLRVVRLGHPARIKPSIAKYGIEALVQSSDGTEIVKDVRKELQSHLRFLSRGNQSRGSPTKKSKPPKGYKDKIDRKTAYREIRELRKEVRKREEKVVSQLIISAHVVLATTVGAENRVLNQITNPRDGDHSSGRPGFDLVIIDEAAQALEASCWIPILRGRKVVLAGDHCQLPPTIKSNDERVVEGLGVTLFERLMNRDISRMLKIQYRMHHKIADWASQAMYHGELQTHDSVKSRTLGQLESIRKREEDALSQESIDKKQEFDHLRNTTLLMIDTAGCDMYESETEAGSRYNEGEAMLVSQHVRKLIEMGVDPLQIAIITPYNGQVELLRNKLLPEFPKLEIRSVDGFQGGEKEAVVLSLVRSSGSHGRGGASGIGFLKDDRRQNVAVTRAKRHLAVICDSETVSQSRFIRNLLQWVGDHGEEHSAIEYISESIHSASHQEYEDDLKAAESELMKLIEQPSPPTTLESKVPTSNKTKNNDLPNNVSANKISDAEQKMLEESKRNAMMDRIAHFLQNGTKGEEMVLSSDLSSFDRRLVHEFAEQSDLGHRSEGREGIDRKIILKIQTESLSTIIACQKATDQSSKVKETIDATSQDENLQREEDGTPGSSSKFVSNFSALALDDDDSESEKSTTDTNQDDEKPNSADFSTSVPTGNSLLAQLAKERTERQRQEQQQKTQSMTGNSGASSKKKKKKKAKGKKLGGAKKSPPPPKDEDNFDDLDDMAFLDTQIEKSQNTHGRKVVGKGKNYRTVVNGILNANPEPRTKTNNNSTSSALRAKLSQAENSRKKKKKK